MIEVKFIAAFTALLVGLSGLQPDFHKINIIDIDRPLQATPHSRIWADSSCNIQHLHMSSWQAENPPHRWDW